MNVQELRKQGYKIRVSHQRFYNFGGKRQLISNFLVKVQKNFYLGTEPLKLNDALSKGGRTTVWITDQQGVSVTAIADCSKKDHYNKKVGLSIALGRALKELGV